MDFGNIINNLLDQMAFFHLEAGNYVMIVVALVFLYLAILSLIHISEPTRP